MFSFQLKTPDSISVADSGIDCTLLEEINRQAAVVLNSPLISRKTRDDPEDPLPTNNLTTAKTNFSYVLSKPHGSFDLTLQTNNTSKASTTSSSPQQAASEPPRSPPPLTPSSSSDLTTVFTENHAPNSSHLGILLLSNARRKLQLEEERIEFEKEKQREKEKRKSKKLFFRLTKRVREKGGGMVDIPQSASDSALKRIDEDEISTSGHSSFFGQHRNTSTE
uniref:Uncharacterized protein n=1 Tax=Panagrolaimus superbus TaxID=310955 RepID=A0A914Z2Z5_9BILA